jgi:hypothetical protein
MTGPRYFAVADPDDPTRITYWRRADSGQLAPWPAKARYGPALYRKPGPGHQHVIPAGLSGEERRQWLLAWIEDVSAPWHRRAHEAIKADPLAAAARFATLQCACVICGRSLSDVASRTYGVGPECRGSWPDARLADAAEAVGRAHAEMLERQSAAV